MEGRITAQEQPRIAMVHLHVRVVVSVKDLQCLLVADAAVEDLLSDDIRTPLRNTLELARSRMAFPPIPEFKLSL